MTSALVQRFRNDVAPRLLAKFGNGGVDVVLQVVTPTPNPLEPDAVDYVREDVKAVARGVSSSILTADPNLVASDVQVICAAIDYVPAVADVVAINGTDKRVVRVDAIPAAGDPAIYRFFLR